MKKKYKLKKCPKCGSNSVSVVIGEIGLWQCMSCTWDGENIETVKVTEKEYLIFSEQKNGEIN